MSSGLLYDRFGHIDIYLFDQFLRGRIVPGMRVVDMGCGTGRNLVHLLRDGYDVYATDREPEAVDAVRALARGLAPALGADHFRVEPVEQSSFADATFDVVISNAVLHFARDDAHFEAMVKEMWRVLRPGGLFFARLASSIGMADRMQPLGNSRYLMPDGSERYLVDETTLMATTRRLGGRQLDPLKTTIVQDQRCMTTWVLER
ncbi:MAG: class I SAM-dependent methyltransferase [Acidobacteria bacterium]|nr:class I SAM-dependent methyltransferase [Acidobacteriota bacterium]